MHFIALLLGLFFCLSVMLDAFQTVILPRRPKGRFRITRLFFVATWRPWAAVAGLSNNPRVRDQAYSIFGPISLLLLLVLWATLLVGGFGFLFFALGSHFHDPLEPRFAIMPHLLTDFYVSGTSLFTLGPGDVTPFSQAERALIVLESGVGLGFVALVIGYVPVIYTAFSKREISVALLDGRAGSPPTAGELIRRHAYSGGDAAIASLLEEWEKWSAEVLESHISYPILCYYRSQHDNQNWLAALVCILDTCALLITVLEGEPVRQAQLTFAMGRHVLIDIGHVFQIHQDLVLERGPDRLPDATYRQLCTSLDGLHLKLCDGRDSRARLHEIRELYEPSAELIAHYMRIDLPTFLPDPNKRDPWKTIAALSNSPTLPTISSGNLAETLHDKDHVL